MLAPKFCPACADVLHIIDVEGHQRPVCQGCGFVYYLDPKVAVAVIVPYGDGIVLGRRAIDPGLGAWSFPSGYVDRGEVVEEAAIREVREEIGLDIGIDGLIGLYSSAGETVILVVYAGSVLGGQLAAGPEMSELGIFAPDHLPSMAFSHDRQIIADWRQFRERQADAVSS